MKKWEGKILNLTTKMTIVIFWPHQYLLVQFTYFHNNSIIASVLLLPVIIGTLWLV